MIIGSGIIKGLSRAENSLCVAIPANATSYVKLGLIGVYITNHYIIEYVGIDDSLHP